MARILEIQAAAYAPHLLEAADVFESRIAEHPSGCLGAEGEDGVLSAYVIAFPMTATRSVGLHEAGTPPVTEGVTAPILYVHDLAVHPSVHGSGFGAALVRALELLACRNGQTVIELVAIGSAVPFWEHNGFVATDDDVYAGYGPDARKMRRAV